MILRSLRNPGFAAVSLLACISIACGGRTTTDGGDGRVPDAVAGDGISGGDVVPTDGTCPAGLIVCGASCVDLSNDPLNCGGCGMTCPSGANGTASCASGMCGLTCTAGFGNCDGNAANGCETNVQTDGSHCGMCGRACMGSGNTCTAGMCTMGTCPTGRADCDGNTMNGCETDTTGDLMNCGACGTRCMTANGTPSCTMGACATASCNTGFADCDMMTSTGCETDTTMSMTHCGACGMSCVLPNATSRCGMGTCSLTMCNSGFGNCDGLLANGCEADLNSNASACGACGNTCPVRPNATAACRSAMCAVACNAGFGDCDGNNTNGCELPIIADIRNCGSCGATCVVRPNSVANCAAGMCGFTCNGGFSDCNSNPGDGCEAFTMSDAANCGMCGRACAGGEFCTGGMCRAIMGGPTFRVVSLTGTRCNTVEHFATTGDDHGGIALTSSRVLVTGDFATGRFDLANLSGAASTGRQSDGMISNLRTGLAYTFAIGMAPVNTTGGIVNNLIQLDSTTGALTGTVIPLSANIPLIGRFGGTLTGFFSGYDRAVVLTNGRAYHIALPAGTVTDMGPMASPPHTACDNWAHFGIAEFYGSSVYIVYVQNNRTIARTRVPDGMTATVATFANLGDMCSIVISPSRSRWYFHVETASQFMPLPAVGAETLGTCDATWDQPGGACDTGATTCGGGCRFLPTDDSNCGTCGTACTSGENCSAGTCGCAPGATTCTGRCVYIATDLNNCGGCGTVCPPRANGVPSCTGSACGVICNAGFGNCNGALADGCEAPLDSPTNCGVCGRNCPAPMGGTATCTAGVCGGMCPAGQTDCGGTCRDLGTDLMSCGACGRTCGAGQSCITGSCRLTMCPAGSGFADCNAMSADGCEVLTSSDPRNCGACGMACMSGRGCAAGMCAACNAAAPRVLIYGPAGNLEQPFLPAGATVTSASAVMWRSMTTADFAGYNLILIGDLNGGGPTAADLLAAFETRAIWNPAVTGRVIVNTIDPGFHATLVGAIRPGAVTYLRAALAWAASGPGTGLFASGDWARRNFDYLSGFGAFTENNNTADLARVTTPAHPAMAGSTDMTLSNWTVTYHATLTRFPAPFVQLVNVPGNLAQSLVIARNADCIP